METHLSASVGPILPAATLISGLLSWFSPLFFVEASPEPLQPLYLLDTLPPAPCVPPPPGPLFELSVKRERNGERRTGKRRGTDDDDDNAAFRRIVPPKETDVKAARSLLSLSLCSVLLYTPLLLFLSRSLFVYARTPCHTGKFMQSITDQAARPREWNHGGIPLLKLLLLCLSVLRIAAEILRVFH